MAEINFKYGALIRTGPKLVNGGKWDATSPTGCGTRPRMPT